MCSVLCWLSKAIIINALKRMQQLFVILFARLSCTGFSSYSVLESVSFTNAVVDSFHENKSERKVLKENGCQLNFQEILLFRKLTDRCQKG